MGRRRQEEASRSSSSFIARSTLKGNVELGSRKVDIAHSAGFFSPYPWSLTKIISRRSRVSQRKRGFRSEETVQSETSRVETRLFPVPLPFVCSFLSLLLPCPSVFPSAIFIA